MDIIIIEDNTNIGRAYEKILSDDGHYVEISAIPLVAVSKILRKKYDLILLDLMLPEMSGDEIMKRVRSEGIKTPIVITTNMGSGFDEAELLSAGASRIVLKSKMGPVELRELVAEFSK